MEQEFVRQEGVSYIMKAKCMVFLVSVLCMLTVCVVRGQSTNQEQGKLRGFLRGGMDKNAKHDAGDGILQDGIFERLGNNFKLGAEIGLSEEQIKTLKNSAADMRKQQDELQKQLKDCGLDQARMMTAEGTVDENAILAAVEKAGKIRTEMAKIRIQHMLLVKRTLTPDQISKLKDLIQKHGGKLKGDGKELKEGKDGKDHLKKHSDENPAAVPPAPST